MQWAAWLDFIKGASLLELIYGGIFLIYAVRSGIIKTIDKKASKQPEKVEISEEVRIHHNACVTSVDALVAEKLDIKYRRIMKEQMRVVEAALESTIRLFRDNFYDELKLKLGGDTPNLIDTLDMKHYNSVIEIVEKRLHKDIQNMMRENGLAEKSDAEMQLYLYDRTEKLTDVVTQVFNVYYGGNNLVIPRDELHYLNKRIGPKLADKFKTAILECRAIAIKGKQDMADKDLEIEAIRNKPCHTK